MSFPVNRKKTAQIRIGNVSIGGTAPVAVQSMTNTRTDEYGGDLKGRSRLLMEIIEAVRA